jgi:hypothetical protein
MNMIHTYMPYGKVLVVDDVATNLDVARGLMLPYGLTIDCASGGIEAIEKIRMIDADPEAPKYDVILMTCTKQFHVLLFLFTSSTFCCSSSTSSTAVAYTHV